MSSSEPTAPSSPSALRQRSQQLSPGSAGRGRLWSEHLGGLEASVVSTGQLLRWPGAVPTGSPLSLLTPQDPRVQQGNRLSCAPGTRVLRYSLPGITCLVTQKMLGATQDFEASRGKYVRISFRRISCVALRSQSSRLPIFSDPASPSQLNTTLLACGAGAAFTLVSRQFPPGDK